VAAKCHASRALTRSTHIVLSDLLLIQNHSLSASSPDVCTVSLPCLATAVTCTNAETSFSKPKIIKNYRRSAMNQQRLHGLTVTSAEQVLASQLNSDEIRHHLRKWKQGTKTFQDVAFIMLIFTTRRSSSPGRVKNCSLLHSVQTGSGAHPASYPMGTGGSFPGGKAPDARS
jgi:hypothetical protein